LKIDTNQPLARFGFMHLIATNMCVWLKTIINEILDEYLELNEVAQPTLNASLTQNVTTTTLAQGQNIDYSTDNLYDCKYYRPTVNLILYISYII